MKNNRVDLNDLVEISSYFSKELSGGTVKDLLRRWKGGASFLLAASDLKPDSVASALQEKLIDYSAKGITDDVVGAVLLGIESSREASPRPTVLMTIPNRGGKTSKQTRSFADAVGSAERSLVCMTYNFQKSTQYFDELKRLATRDGFELEIYVDGKLAHESEQNQGRFESLTLKQIRWHFPKAHIFASKRDGERWITSHAKVFVIDGTKVLITSANFSESAENRNVEIGVVFEDAVTAKQITDQLALINQGSVYQEYR